MRYYTYHLAFELYKDAPADRSSEYSGAVHIPSPGTDIFASEDSSSNTSLPLHSTYPWGESFGQQDERILRKRAQSDSANNPNHSHLQLRPKKPRSKSSSSPAQGGSAKSPDTKRAAAERDYRFDRVSVVSIDMVDTTRPAVVRGKSAIEKQKASDAVVSGTQATKGRFIPLEPKNTELGWGVVHLYREDETAGLYDDATIKSKSVSSEAAGKLDPNADGTMLCILAVPSYMSPSDLLGYVGEKTSTEDVSHFRMIRTGRANKYMVLMKFRDVKRAQEWQKEYNGKLFNSMEPEYCHVVFVQSVTFDTSLEASPPQISFPNMTNDPFRPTPANVDSSAIESSSAATSLTTTKPFAPPTPALVELPTCPVCLERMDESTTGLLTIQCQHVFHCGCLEKWKGSGCPVCRYTQSAFPLGPGSTSLAENSVPNECSVCGTNDNLWICLICGVVGCGRYVSAHAFEHWESTGHSFAMDIERQHVWDYAGDGFVHRLIQSKGDGKLLELPKATNSFEAFGADMVPREKMEAMGNEYTYLLTSQLEGQRLYFEEQLERAVDKARTSSKAEEQAQKLQKMLEGKLNELSQKVDALNSSLIDAHVKSDNLAKDLNKQKGRADKFEGMARKMTEDWKEEKTVNSGLLNKIKHLETKIKEKEEIEKTLEMEKRELEEQNRDLSFFISGGEKLQELKEQGEDIDGKVEVPLKEEEKGKGKKKKR